jgi:hypothetical protein
MPKDSQLALNTVRFAKLTVLCCSQMIEEVDSGMWFHIDCLHILIGTYDEILQGKPSLCLHCRYHYRV